MERLGKSLIGLMALTALASPAKALTEEEIAIGLQLASCFSSNGCYHRNNAYHYPQYPSPSYHNQYPSHPPYYRNFPHSNPRIIIVPTQPQYRYTPPYSGYYFEQNRRRFKHNFNSYDYSRRHWDVRGQINQIYRDVLGRDADLGGLHTYQDRYNNGWSLTDIQRDIANSQEARNLRRF